MIQLRRYFERFAPLTDEQWEDVAQRLVRCELPKRTLLLGLLAIWFSPYAWLKEWAYAGFVFDFVGAIFGFVALSQWIMPDIIMAPLASLLCLLAWWTEPPAVPSMPRERAHASEPLFSPGPRA